MFDRLDDILIRYQQIMEELNDPDVVNDQKHFRKLMKEQSDLQPLVEKYTEYKNTKQTIDDSLEMLEAEDDEEMKEMLKEELSEAKSNITKIEQELKALFPDTELLRMDADTVAASGSHEELLRTFREKKIPILLGTQMVAKGLDFPSVTLVGVLDADMSLYVDNFRAA